MIHLNILSYERLTLEVINITIGQIDKNTNGCKTLRVAVFCMYIHITTGSDRECVTLTSKVIRDHLRSLEVTDVQTLPTTFRDVFVFMYTHMAEVFREQL